MTTPKTIFRLVDCVNTVSKLTGKIKYFLLLLFVVLSFVLVNTAQTPVFVKNYRFGGQVTHFVNGSYVPYAGLPVLVKTVTKLGNAAGDYITVTTTTAVVVTDSNGRYEHIFPCYADANGVWGTGFDADARSVGSLGGRSGSGGLGIGCNFPDTFFLNWGFNADTSSEEDLQNAGLSCSKGEPVNMTNGNMWLGQTDYSLPGIGENIKINRFYNSNRQQSGIFGFGWSTDYDESISNYDDFYLTLKTGSGRGFYFISVGNNVFTSASLGFYATVVKNTDNTYTLTFKNGAVHKFHTNGRLDWQKDRNGNQTNLTYSGSNGTGNLTGITDAFGRTLNIVPNTNGTVQKIYDSLTSISNPVATYEYDPTNSALLKTVTYNDGAKYKFEYTTVNVNGVNKTYLQTVKDALDNILETHAYDSQGRATTSEKQGGVEKYTFDYTHWTDTLPYTSITYKKNVGDSPTEEKYYFDKSKGRNVITKTEGACSCGGGSETKEYFYDANLNLTKTLNALGHETTATYDNTGNRLTWSEKIGTTDLGTEKFTYNTFGQVLTYKDKIDSPTANNTVVNVYDASGNLKTTTNALGKVTTIDYPATNNKGLPDSTKDARNNITKFKWNAAGLLEEIEDPYTKKTNYTYDARGRVKTITNALAHVTTYNYDDDTDRTVEMIYPNSDKITYKYDIRRLLESVTDERGKLTSYEFDSAYRLKKITDPLLHTREYDYDLMSNLKLTKDALSNQTDYKYDDFNRLKEVEYPAASSGATRLKELFEYDKLGRIKKLTDTANRVTNYGYDDALRTNTVTNAELETTTTKYNARYQMIQVTDAKNQVYDFTYDPLGRMLTQTRAGATMSYEYDAVGNRAKRTDYLGRETSYEYDNLNRLKKINYLQNVANVYPSPTPIQTVVYTYDDISRLKTATNDAGTVTLNYDNRNRIKDTTDVFGHLVEYDYTLTGTVNQRSLKFDGAAYAQYNFDDADRLTSLVDSNDSTTISFGYDEADKLKTRILPNGVTTTYDYDNLNRLKRLKDVSPTATLFDRQYTYNTASQIDTITEPTQTRSFGYDNVDRLLSMTNGTANESYTFDDVGNRTASHRSASYNYQSGQFNRVASTATANYAYDANGNTVSKAEGKELWRFTWDYENRLTIASTRKQSIRYRYDALGRRVQRYFVGTKENTKFIYDGQDVLVDDNNGVLTKYQNGSGIDNKLKVSTNGTAKYFLADHLGSTSGLVDASGNLTEQTSYDSFGNASTNLSTRYQFTGREFDNFTGLHYYRARWYDGNLGRFISEDPIGLAGGINQFAYSGNNSVNRTDPSGLYSDGREEVIAAIVAEAARIVTIPGVGQIIIYGAPAFALGYAIGYGPGQLSARLFYPDQFPDTQTQPETCPIPKPKPQPVPTPTPDDKDGKELVLGMSPYEEELRSELASQNPSIQYTTYIREKGPVWTEEDFMELAIKSRKIHFELRYGFNGQEYAAFEKKIDNGATFKDIGGNYTYKEFYLITHRGLRGKTKFYE